jgi:hypothetical protein
MKQLILVTCLSISVTCFSQNRSNTWELSYSNDLMYPNSEMIFINGSVDTLSVARIMSFLNTNTSISDTSGNLLFYTNGLSIGNRDYDTLLNATNFNSGGATSNDEPDGLSACQGALILPYPDDQSLYYLFHITGESFFANNQSEVQPLYLSYSVVDLNLDGGLGGVEDDLKNVHIIDDTLTWGRLTACKHANGRDWWVIMHRYYSNIYYKLLVTPSNILGPYEQSIGSIITKDIGGQATFAPDGFKFAMVSPNNILDFFEFDRCTGEFYNSQLITIPDSTGTLGCSFSSNSRFLYVSSKYNLFQYDTWSTNMVADVIHIASWDNFYDGIVPVLYFMHQLAPDNKIYISPFNGVLYLNVINQPDSLGIACDFEPHSFVLPQYNVNVPSFPNYDLGALIGSPCDTLYLSDIKPQERNGSFRISPNPAVDWFNIVYNTDHDISATIYDAFGREVKEFTLYPWFKNRIVYVDELPAGVYLLTLSSQSRKQTMKLIVAK